MKKIKLIAAIVICSMVILVGSAFAAYMSKDAVTKAAKEKYAEFNLQTFKYTGSWKKTTEYKRDGDTIEKIVEAFIPCTVTSAKEKDGTYKIYTGLMILSGGDGEWDFDRFYVAETETMGLKKMSAADINTMVVEAYKNCSPSKLCSLLDTVPSRLLYIAEIKPITSTVKTPTDGEMTMNVDITFGTRSGYTGIDSQTRTVFAEFRKTDGVWDFVVSRNVAYKDQKSINIPRAQADSLKTLQSAGWDAIYGKTEPQQ
ncbi:MAG: hypothetical protein WC890_02125 [Candidatus Margulisiibacteriota bacterium]